MEMDSYQDFLGQIVECQCAGGGDDEDTMGIGCITGVAGLMAFSMLFTELDIIPLFYVHLPTDYHSAT